MKLRTGDKVIVITGKDKGKTGKIVRVFGAKNKVIVEGLNMMKKHQRPRKTNEQGSMVDMAVPLNASNVMILDPKSGKQTRIGKKKVDNKMVRIARKSNQEI